MSAVISFMNTHTEMKSNLVFWLLVIPHAYVGAASTSTKIAKNKEIKYIVYPGLDVDNANTAGWLNGYSSPWNVFFGNQPYVVGWVGEEDPEYELDADSVDYESEEYQEQISTNVADAPHDQVTEDRKKTKQMSKSS